MFKKFFEKNKEHSVAIISFFIFSIFFTLPLLSRITTHVPGGYGDAIQSIAYLQNFANYVEGLDLRTAGGWGAVLTENLSNIFSFFFYSKLAVIYLSPIVSYNLSYLISFFLAGLFTYLLGISFGLSKKSSFLMGFIFTFAPVHFAYGSGFRGAMHIELIPLFVFALVLFLKNFSLLRVIFLAIAFLTLASTEHHFGFFAIMFAIPVVFYYLYLRNKDGFLKRFDYYRYGLVFILGGISGVFLYYDLLVVAFSGENYLKVAIIEQVTRSLDLLHFFIPSNNHFLWGAFFDKNIWSLLAYTGDYPKHYSEVSGYVTYVGLFFFLVGLFQWRRLRKQLHARLWIFLALSFFLFSMGPFFSFLGPISPAIPLPGVLLYENIPFISNIRAIGRFFPFGLIAFLVIVGASIDLFIQRFDKKNRNIIFLAIFAILALELGYVPDLVKVEYPELIKSISKDRDSYTVLNINSAYCYVCESQFRLYNGYHRKETLGGRHFARGKPGHFVEKTTPFVKELLYDYSIGLDGSRNVVKHDYRSFASHVLDDEDVELLIFDKQWLVPEYYEDFNKDTFVLPEYYTLIKNKILENLNVEEYWNDNDMLAYKVLPPEGEKDYILLRQPRDAENVFVKNLGTGEEYIPFSNGDVLQLENYTEDAVYIKMQLSSPGIIGSEQFILKHAGEEYVFSVTNERRWIGLVLPKTTESVSEIEFMLPEDIEIQAHYITYESSVDFNKSKEEILNSIEEDYYSVVYYDESIGIGLPKDSLYKGLAELDAVTDGVLDFEKIDLSRDIYTDEYYALYLYSLLKKNSINAVLFEKFDESFSQNYDGVLRKRFDLFDVTYENDRFILYQLKDFNDELFQDSIDLVFLRGIDPPTLNIHGYEGLSIYRYRKIHPQFSLGSYDSLNEPHILSFNIFGASFVQELEKYSFEVVDRDGERKRKIPFNKQMDVEVEGHDFTFTLLDSEGEIVRFEEDQGMVMYNLSLKKKE